MIICVKTTGEKRKIIPQFPEWPAKSIN